jgi:CBS domain-containing protein
MERIREEHVRLSPIQATLFLAGIYEDTGNLTFPATVPEDATAVAFLLEQQADLDIIRRFLRPVYGPKQKDILFEMLKNPKREKVNEYNISFSALDIQGHIPGLAVVVAMYQDIMNVDASFGVFRDTKTKRAMVIGRSSAEGLNIGAVMRSLGGGGHPNAGSAIVKDGRPDALHEQIVMFIRGHKQRAVQISDLMSFPVSYVPPTGTMKEVALILRQKGCTGLPVLDGDTLMGIISRRDFKKIKKPEQLELPVKAFMSDKVITIAAESSVVQAAKLMVKHDIGRLPVMKDGAVIGIITRSDAMRYYYDLLPD